MNRNMDMYYLSEDNYGDYLKEIGKIPLLTLEEEKELGYKILEGNKEAIDKMIIHNLRLVVSIAKTFIEFGLPILDLIEEGNIGLIYAANHYDVTKGFRFSTFATKWIVEKIEVGIANSSRNIRIPYYRFAKLIKYSRLKKQLTARLNRVPTDLEIATEMNESVERIKLYEDLINDTLSLNYMLDEDIEFSNLITGSRSVEDQVIENDLHNEIALLFSEAELNERDIDILIRRYNLDDNGIMTYDEIGNKYNKSKSWAQQREKNALKKIKKTKYFRNTYIK